MNKLLIILIALTITAPARADIKDDRIAELERENRLLKADVYRAKRASGILRKIISDSKDAKFHLVLNDEILALRKQVKALGGKVAGNAPLVGSGMFRKFTFSLTYPPKIGTGGQLADGINESFEVAHVIDSTSLLIGKTRYRPDGNTFHHAGYFIVTGLDTAEYITKQSFRIPIGMYTVINPATFNQRKYLTLDFKPTASK